jgi:hypothetical protein
MRAHDKQRLFDLEKEIKQKEADWRFLCGLVWF